MHHAKTYRTKLTYTRPSLCKISACIGPYSSHMLDHAAHPQLYHAYTLSIAATLLHSLYIHRHHKDYQKAEIKCLNLFKIKSSISACTSVQLKQ